MAGFARMKSAKPSAEPGSMGDKDGASKDDLVAVSVRFRASKIAFGSARYCQASVNKSFFDQMTSLNELIVFGSVQNEKATAGRRLKRPVSALENTPTTLQDGFEADRATTMSPSQESKRSLVSDEINGDLAPRKSYHEDAVITLTSTTSLLSPYYLDSLVDKKALLKKLQSIDACDLEITCSFDLWLWVEIQKIFAPVNPSIHDPSILSLLDTGLEKRCKQWFEPLEKRWSLRDIGVLAHKLPLHDLVHEGAVPRAESSAAECPLHSAIQSLEQELVENNHSTNLLLCKLRAEHIEQDDFWREGQEVSREKEQLRSALQRLAKLKASTEKQR